LQIDVADHVEIRRQVAGGEGEVTLALALAAGLPEAAKDLAERLVLAGLAVELGEPEDRVGDQRPLAGVLGDEGLEVLDRALGALDLLHAVGALAVELLGGALVAGVGRRRRGEPAEADAGEREGRPGARATGPGLHRPRMTPA